MLLKNNENHADTYDNGVEAQNRAVQFPTDKLPADGQGETRAFDNPAEMQAGARRGKGTIKGGNMWCIFCGTNVGERLSCQLCNEYKGLVENDPEEEEEETKPVRTFTKEQLEAIEELEKEKNEEDEE